MAKYGAVADSLREAVAPTVGCDVPAAALPSLYLLLQAIINGIAGVLLPKPSAPPSMPKPQPTTKAAVTLPSSGKPFLPPEIASKPAVTPYTPAAIQQTTPASGKDASSVSISLPPLFGKPGLTVRLDLKKGHRHHMRHLRWDMREDFMSRDRPDAGSRGPDRGLYGRRITGKLAAVMHVMMHCLRWFLDCTLGNSA